MKELRTLFLPGSGFILFIAGLLTPFHYSIARDGLLITGAFVVLVFYFITLTDVIKNIPPDSSKKIFWLIAIICVPVVGNIIYVIFREMANRRQQPHGVW